MPASWPLVGRAEELELVERVITNDASHGVVIAGAAGVGKTRLTSEAIALAQAGGMQTEWAGATHSAATMPFGAFAHLLPADARTSERLELFGRIATLLSERAAGRRLVLAVDDAHLLDDSSAALLAFLVQSDSVWLVASLRSGEAAPDAVVNLWKDGVVERLELQPLSRDETSALLESALGGQVDGAALERLWNAARGNPLLLRELVLAARADRRLTADAGVWRWSGTFPAAAPRLAELVEQRVGRVGAEEREVLDAVAAAEPVAATVLEAITSREAVASAGRTGLLELVDDHGTAVVRLVHPLYGDVLRARIGALVARDLKRRLADAVEQTGPRGPDDMLRVATWRVESGTAERPEVLIAAAQRAMTLFDFALAVRLAEAAREAGGGVSAGATLAEAFVGMGRFADVEALLAGLEPACESDDERIAIVTARAQNLFWRLLDPVAARELIERAAAATTAPAAQMELASARAMFALFEGHPDAATEIAAPIVDMPGRLGVEAAMTLSWALIVVGRFDAAIDVIGTALARLDAMPEGVPFARDWLVKSHSAAEHFAGRVRGGIDVAETAYRESIERNADLGRALHAFALGWVELTAGAVEASARHHREAAAVLREVNVFGHLPGALGELAQAEALLGNATAAQAASAEAEASATNRMGEVMIGLGRAWAAAAAGEMSRAREEARRTADTTGALGQRTFQALALHHALRLGDDRVSGELAQLAAGIDGELFATCAAHAAAEQAGDATALDDVSTRFEAIGARLLAAEAAAGASLAYANVGRSDSARRSAARASSLAATCGDVSTPMLARLRESPELTAREREIAALAAAGLASRDIAQRLVLSVRTVDNHLRSVYVKLGVKGRGDLAGVLGPPVE